MEAKPVLALPEGLELIGLEQMADLLVITVASTQSSPRCPLCGVVAQRVHSRYTRRVADLPCGGQPIRLFLQVRKCFCEEGACPRKIFVERLTPFIDSHGRVTRRLFQVVQVIGLATGGRLGVRVTDRIGIQTSRQTIIRRILALPTEPAGQVIELGVDDFSFRRGRTFGTILVDLSSHQVIDLLPERSVESAAAWMQNHPEIQYVSRDRGNDYAQAAREGAPQARAVADRFHIYKNLVEAIEPVVARCYKEIRSESSRDLPEPSEVKLPQIKEWRPARSKAHEHQHQSRLAASQERFESLMTLQKLGIPQHEIARRLGVTTRTIQNWNKRGSCPGSRQRRKRRSLFDPYAAYVLARWKDGCKTGSILCREIKAQGYCGTDRQVYRFLQTLKQEKVELPELPALSRLSVRESLWLLARPLDDLEADERADLEVLCQLSTELTTLHLLVQAFGQIVRKREGHRLDEWKRQVAISGIAELQRFVKGLTRDKEAIEAGLTLVYSNGVVEGKVNKLKLIKRMGYGRASFPLLRHRVLHAL